MSAVANLSALPRVVAILVVHDGAEWLSNVLATLAAQRYGSLDLVVVDNASGDGSAEILARRIPGDRLVTLTRNVGFGRAVVAALGHPSVADADLLLLLHDDVVLDPEAIGPLVAALTADPQLAIVGPKLREWSDDGLLAEVGMTIDRFGRAEPLVEPAELDQGQHDRPAEVLYVSTAGMLLRPEVLRDLGGFDTRFPAYRDDLDLCWRAWLRGHRVAVVPASVGYHIAAGARAGRRFGRGSAFGSRYLAERHALAALLKNYGPLRLAWVLPVVLALGIAKVAVFLAIRRFGEASAVLRAYAWNVVQLPRTLRRRRAVQRARERSDAELAFLFAPGLPRARVYAEAFGAWFAGGSTRVLISDSERAAATAAPQGRSLRRLVGGRPALVTAVLLGAAYLLGLVPLLGRGQVVGGDIAAWPDSARRFLTAYASPWNGAPLATDAFASPVQAMLGVASFAGLGSAWLAQRLLVFGLVPLAWLLALRAGRLLTPQPGPRALGATLYVLSPVVLGALGQGRYGILVMAALLPGVVVLAARAADTHLEQAASWRSAALLALLAAAGTAAAPAAGLLLLAGVLALAVVVATRRGSGGSAAAVRLAGAAAAAAAILSPWLLGLAGLLGRGSLPPSAGVEPAGALPLWRALTVAGQPAPGLSEAGAVLAAITAAAVVASAALLVSPRQPRLVLGLTLAAVAPAVAAWLLIRIVPGRPEAEVLLLVAALALGALGVVAASSLASGGLRNYAFGARQLALVAAVGLLGIGLFGALVRLTSGPYPGLARGPELAPAFVSADLDRVGPYRVLILADRGGEVVWDVTEAQGRSMVEFGTPDSPEMRAALEAAVAGLAGDAGAGAGALLGLANVRYVVVVADGESPRLAKALGDQPALEPQPTGLGRVYRVLSWLPRAAVVPRSTAEVLSATGNPGDVTEIEADGLSPRGPARYSGGPAQEGALLLSDGRPGSWRAEVDGRALPVIEDLGGLIDAGRPLGAETGAGQGWRNRPGATVQVTANGLVRHRVALALQLLIVAAVVSLALRPPGFTQRRVQRRRGGALPRQLAAREAEVTG